MARSQCDDTPLVTIVEVFFSILWYQNSSNFFWKIRKFGQIYTRKKKIQKISQFLNLKKHEQICPIKSLNRGWWIREVDWHAQKSVGNAESWLERTSRCFIERYSMAKKRLGIWKCFGGGGGEEFNENIKLVA